MHSPAPREGQLSKHRLEGLSDGVFAVVMTLLVLEVRVEHLPPHATNAQVWEALFGLKRALLSYAIVFGFTGVFWLLQCRKFALLTQTSARQALLTLVFLFCVTLLPVSVSILIRSATGEGAPTVIYYGNVLLIALALLLAWTDARRGEPTLAHQTNPEADRLTRRIVALVAGSALAATIGYFFPDTAPCVLLGVVLLGRAIKGKPARRVAVHAKAQA